MNNQVKHGQDNNYQFRINCTNMLQDSQRQQRSEHKCGATLFQSDSCVLHTHHPGTLSVSAYNKHACSARQTSCLAQQITGMMYKKSSWWQPKIAGYLSDPEGLFISDSWMTSTTHRSYTKVNFSSRLGQCKTLVTHAFQHE